MAADVGDKEALPSRARMIFAAIAVVVLIVITWAVIEYRSQPPPPPYSPRSAPAKP